MVGPYFKLIENELYKDPSFIKHIPVSERPQYIYDYLYKDGSAYYATDHSQYEAHFTLEIMEQCEFKLYEYMTKNLESGKLFMERVRQIIGGRNYCKFSGGCFEINATRMSGEMNTSLGNGFTNKMVNEFLLKESGCTDYKGVYEGDDGLTRFSGTPPTAIMYSKLGFTIKLDRHESLNTASFCGMVFDLDDRQSLTDPVKVMLNFGWASEKYKDARTDTLLSLLKAKALSFKYQYPACPIVTSLSNYALRITRTLKAKIPTDLTNFKKNMYATAINTPIKHILVGINSRLIVEQVYGISIQQQLSLEYYFDSLNDVQELWHPVFEEIFTKIHSHNYDNFVGDYWNKSVLVMVPPENAKKQTCCKTTETKENESCPEPAKTTTSSRHRARGRKKATYSKKPPT